MDEDPLTVEPGCYATVAPTALRHRLLHARRGNLPCRANWPGPDQRFPAEAMAKCVGPLDGQWTISACPLLTMFDRPEPDTALTCALAPRNAFHLVDPLTDGQGAQKNGPSSWMTRL